MLAGSTVWGGYPESEFKKGEREMHNLVKNIIGSYEKRAEGITSLRREVTAQQQATRAHIREMDETRRSMAQRLRTDLDKGHSDLIQEVDTWMRGVAAAHRAMAKDLEASLGRSRTDRIQEEASRRSEARAWIGGVAAAHAEDRREWQGMAATMRARRSVAAVAVAEPPGATADQHAAGPITLEKRVFKYLADHPNGCRLADLEREFGLSRFQIDRALKSLMEEGKAEKRDRQYYAI
ncbi:MAG: hypothetical protein AB1603_05205 [Chloroflexota bacterium]